MPIYEYKCQDCGTSIEQLLNVCSEDVASPLCPKCKGSHLERQISIFAAPQKVISASACDFCPQQGNGECAGKCGF